MYSIAEHSDSSSPAMYSIARSETFSMILTAGGTVSVWHAHLDDPEREEWEGFPSGTRAAAAGGLTTLVGMPLNGFPSTVSEKTFELKIQAAEKRIHVDIGINDFPMTNAGHIKGGHIDLLSSDHSPLVPELKCLDDGNFLKAWGGISSLQFVLPVTWTYGRKYGITLEQLASWWSEKPAKLVGLDLKVCVRLRAQDGINSVKK
ncbi:hypothetical protein RHMOL_Rhmol13G0047200 [Rhododendron molle]|uniref:Uncharacterized protein n=1 Tax=Rhododendron molle TaxID=49168 RepID=A0ACC0L4I1_RHOML|nr:hypothetical protein RHMOL_Rhmol13G0047200 [Rhododendron molle]